ncbi:hypothetical protein A8H35_05085 [Burkholderia thailandensis]|nr:hypothetical protein WJ27_01610 [Burkholderia thailandensis]AVR09364.1 hypothetical protein A8H31_18190 [Burkholderia thailandensis]AWY57909.1 hypothetical protein A8H35_05085 [Burkholderia thailandensis]AWY67917.1 hypothetical protein A8H36_23240 [Burkholderia thailandensis]KVG09971.1 hypothetical protein WJ25_12205 [Burkholderia thailandensis]
MGWRAPSSGGARRLAIGARPSRRWAFAALAAARVRAARAFVARVRPVRVTAKAVARAWVRAGLRRVGESFVRRARPAACKMSSSARGRAPGGVHVSRPLRPLRLFATHARSARPGRLRGAGSLRKKRRRPHGRIARPRANVG